jgi:hypothetical protein
MLSQNEIDPPQRNRRRERKLWHDQERNMPSLGCTICPDRTICGGLQMKAGFYDCLQLCCGDPKNCDRVCRNHPDFVDRVREVNSFDLCNVPNGPVLAVPQLATMVPIIFHSSSRSKIVPSEVAALPLYEMFDRGTGELRFSDRTALCAAYRISPNAKIVLTGTDRDPPLERWWGYGETKRRGIIRGLKALGIVTVTTPNYSLFTNRPRWDDLHSMKRIALVHQEFLSEGMPTALHVNGRTDRDFERWTEYVSQRPEVTQLAYEFTTGTGQGSRSELHANWLNTIAKSAGRPLQIIVRGGSDILPILANEFANITVLDSSSFMKTMMRKRAAPVGNARLTWVDAPSQAGEALDALLAENLNVVTSWIETLAARPMKGESAAA